MPKPRRRKPLSLVTLARGEGTKKERSEFARAFALVLPRFGSTLDAFHAIRALEQIGLNVGDLGDDAGVILARIRDDPRAEHVMALLSSAETRRAEIESLRARQRQVAIKNATGPRQGEVTRDQAMDFVAHFRNKNGTERGSRTAAAAHFGVDPRTIKKLLGP